MIAVALIVIDVETLLERNTREERFHVGQRIDRDADAADFALRERVIGVVAHLRRQIERHAQAGDALRQQIAVALVRLGGRAESRILPHRPQPAAVHRRLDAARERKSTRARRDRVRGSQPAEVVRRARWAWLVV